MAETAKFDKSEIESGKGMAILSYIIALIPFFAEKKNKYVRYHAVQGMNILIVAVAWVVLSTIISNLIYMALCGTSLWGCLSSVSIVGIIINLVSLAIGVLNIIGLVYAATGQAKEVPLLGKVKIIKK
jgi:uncharacterized membrane protein